MPKVPEHILLVRPSALGDVARTVPLLVSLRKSHPEAEIDWLVQEGFQDAIRCHPALSGVVPFSRADVPNFTNLFPSLGRWWRWVAEVRRRRFDLVVDCQGLFRSAMIALASGAPCRVGFADAREMGWLGLNRRIRTKSVHVVDRTMELAAAWGGDQAPDMRLYVPPECQSWWQVELARRIGTGTYAVLAPTSRWESKQWPADRYESIANWLIESGRVDWVVLVGAGSESSQLSGLKIRSAPWCLDLVGLTGVGQLMAVLEGSALTVANDSAALHLAVGLGTPFVGIFGPTNPAVVGPYGGRRFVAAPYGASIAAGLYRACDDSMMRAVDLETVKQIAETAMAERDWFRTNARGGSPLERGGSPNRGQPTAASEGWNSCVS